MNWDSVRLKRFFSSTAGGAWGSDPEDGDVRLPCIRGTDFDYIQLRVELARAPMRGFSRADVASRAATRGDLIIETSGGGETQPVGRAVLHDLAELVMPTNFAARLRPASDCDARFVSYLLASLYATGRTKAAIKQTTGIQNLDLDTFLNDRVDRPKSIQQRVIADYLDTETDRIDALTMKKRRMIDLLDERFIAFARRELTGGHPTDGWEPGPYWLGPVPRSWLPQKIAWRKSTVSGTTPASDNPRYYDDEVGMPWITTSELRESVITAANRRVTEAAMAAYPALRVAAPGAVLVAMYGATVGRIAILGVPATMNQACCAIFGGIDVDQRYLYWWLRAHREQVLTMAYGAGQPNISQEVVRGLRVPAPPIAEQQAIAGKLDLLAGDHDRLKSRLATQIDLLTEHRQALITAAVTGGIRMAGATA